MLTLAAKKTAKTTLTVLERIADNDQSAVAECVRTHGNWIWSVALKYSDSTEAAEELTMTIFTDIWKFAHRFKLSRMKEEVFVGMITRRRVKGKAEPKKMDIAPDNKFYQSFQSYSKNGEG